MRERFERERESLREREERECHRITRNYDPNPNLCCYLLLVSLMLQILSDPHSKYPHLFLGLERERERESGRETSDRSEWDREKEMRS